MGGWEIKPRSPRKKKKKKKKDKNKNVYVILYQIGHIHMVVVVVVIGTHLTCSRRKCKKYIMITYGRGGEKS